MAEALALGDDRPHCGKTGIGLGTGLAIGLAASALVGVAVLAIVLTRRRSGPVGAPRPREGPARGLSGPPVIFEDRPIHASEYPATDSMELPGPGDSPAVVAMAGAGGRLLAVRAVSPGGAIAALAFSAAALATLEAVPIGQTMLLTVGLTETRVRLAPYQTLYGRGSAVGVVVSCQDAT